jgi:hypothetical protein
MYISFGTTQQLFFDSSPIVDRQNQSCSNIASVTICMSMKGNVMTLDELLQKTTLYKVAKILDAKPTSLYKWKKTGKIPPLRLYQLKEKMPEWFEEKHP